MRKMYRTWIHQEKRSSELHTRFRRQFSQARSTRLARWVPGGFSALDTIITSGLRVRISCGTRHDMYAVGNGEAEQTTTWGSAAYLHCCYSGSVTVAVYPLSVVNVIVEKEEGERLVRRMYT